MYLSPFMYRNLFPPEDMVARRQTRDASTMAEELQDRLDRMSLLTMAVWTLVGEKLGITDDELKQRVEQLDLSDGKLDGKISKDVGECPKCKRQLSKRHRSCIYCGFKLAATFPG